MQKAPNKHLHKHHPLQHPSARSLDARSVTRTTLQPASPARQVRAAAKGRKSQLQPAPTTACLVSLCDPPACPVQSFAVHLSYQLLTQTVPSTDPPRPHSPPQTPTPGYAPNGFSRCNCASGYGSTVAPSVTAKSAKTFPKACTPPGHLPRATSPSSLANAGSAPKARSQRGAPWLLCSAMTRCRRTCSCRLL